MYNSFTNVLLHFEKVCVWGGGWGVIIYNSIYLLSLINIIIRHNDKSNIFSSASQTLSIYILKQNIFLYRYIYSAFFFFKFLSNMKIQFCNCFVYLLANMYCFIIRIKVVRVSHYVIIWILQ